MLTDDGVQLVGQGIAGFMLTLGILTKLTTLGVIRSEDAIGIVDRAYTDFDQRAPLMSDPRVATEALTILRMAKTSFEAEMQRRTGSVQ